MKRSVLHYCKVEGVSSNNLMRMGSRIHAWGDQWVGTLDSELRATKPKHVLRRGSLRQKRTRGKSVPQHDEFVA
jgi:hypothetical protein